MQFSSLTLISLLPLLSSIVSAAPVSDEISIVNERGTTTDCKKKIPGWSGHLDKGEAWRLQDGLNHWTRTRPGIDGNLLSPKITQGGSCCVPIAKSTNTPYILMELCLNTCDKTKFSMSGPQFANYAAGIINTCSGKDDWFAGGKQFLNENSNIYIKISESAL